MSALADRRAPAGRRVAVVCVDPDVDRETGFQGPELRELVLGERLGRIYVEGPLFGTLQQPLQDWEVVAQSLAAGGGRDDHEVAAAADGGIGLRLVRVQPLDAAPAEGRYVLRATIGGQRRAIRVG